MTRGLSSGAEGHPDDRSQEVAKELADLLKDTLDQSASRTTSPSTCRGAADQPRRGAGPAVGASAVPAALRRSDRAAPGPQRMADDSADPGPNPATCCRSSSRGRCSSRSTCPRSLRPAVPTDQDESLPIERALREAVPGRVSRRYGYQQQSDRTWLPLPPETAGGVIDVTSSLQVHPGRNLAPGGAGHVRGDPSPPDRPLTPAGGHRPVPGIPIWGTQILAPTAGLSPADIPDPSAWAGRVTSVGFATHAAGNPAEVRRMTTGATCETTYTRGKTVTSAVRYALDGKPAALGFRLTVDGARFDLAPLDLGNAEVAAHLSSPGWRSFAFTAAIREDPRLDDIANTFQRGWLTLVYLTRSRSPDWTGPARRTRSTPRWPAAGGAASCPRSSGSCTATTPRRVLRLRTTRKRLTELSENQSVRDCLDEHGRLLWAADAPQHGGPGAAYLPGHRRSGHARGGAARVPGRPGPGPHRRRGSPEEGTARRDLADRDLDRRTGPHRATRGLLRRIRGGSGASWTARSDPTTTSTWTRP